MALTDEQREEVERIVVGVLHGLIERSRDETWGFGDDWSGFKMTLMSEVEKLLRMEPQWR